MKSGAVYLILLLSLYIHGQTGEQTAPPPRPAADSESRFEPLKSIGGYERFAGRTARFSTLENVRNIYRKPTGDELKTLLPDVDRQKKLVVFLRQENTGLTRLMAERGCAASPNVLNVSDECTKFQMPGAGASFSFRIKNYRLRRLSDLTFENNSFQSIGLLSHALLVNIGDVPLETVSNESAGLSFLNAFQAAVDFPNANRIDEELTTGIESDGFFYARHAEVRENSTYILRVIAYRGNLFRSLDGFVYDELDFDNRRDVTIAFRTVCRDADSVTILWKIIADKKSPALKKPSREELKSTFNESAAHSQNKQ